MNKIKIGPQYSKDREFKKKARYHQSDFRANTLKLKDYSEYGNRLSEKDAKNGFNFYDGYDIFKLVKQSENFSKKLYSDMLRSEHIPWNLFIPFREEKDIFKKVFSNLLDLDIVELINIDIEYAPSLKKPI